MKKEESSYSSFALRRLLSFVALVALLIQVVNAEPVSDRSWCLRTELLDQYFPVRGPLMVRSVSGPEGKARVFFLQNLKLEEISGNFEMRSENRRLRVKIFGHSPDEMDIEPRENERRGMKIRAKANNFHMKTIDPSDDLLMRFIASSLLQIKSVSLDGRVGMDATLDFMPSEVLTYDDPEDRFSVKNKPERYIAGTPKWTAFGGRRIASEEPPEVRTKFYQSGESPYLAQLDEDKIKVKDTFVANIITRVAVKMIKSKTIHNLVMYQVKRILIDQLENNLPPLLGFLINPLDKAKTLVPADFKIRGSLSLTDPDQNGISSAQLKISELKLEASPQTLLYAMQMSGYFRPADDSPKAAEAAAETLKVAQQVMGILERQPGLVSLKINAFTKDQNYLVATIPDFDTQWPPGLLEEVMKLLPPNAAMLKQMFASYIFRPETTPTSDTPSVSASSSVSLDANLEDSLDDLSMSDMEGGLYDSANGGIDLSASVVIKEGRCYVHSNIDFLTVFLGPRPIKVKGNAFKGQFSLSEVKKSHKYDLFLSKRSPMSFAFEPTIKYSKEEGAHLSLKASVAKFPLSVTDQSMLGSQAAAMEQSGRHGSYESWDGPVPHYYSEPLRVPAKPFTLTKSISDVKFRLEEFFLQSGVGERASEVNALSLSSKLSISFNLNLFSFIRAGAVWPDYDFGYLWKLDQLWRLKDGNLGKVILKMRCGVLEYWKVDSEEHSVPHTAGVKKDYSWRVEDISHLKIVEDVPSLVGPRVAPIDVRYCLTFSSKGQRHIFCDNSQAKISDWYSAIILQQRRLNSAPDPNFTLKRGIPFPIRSLSLPKALVTKVPASFIDFKDDIENAEAQIMELERYGSIPSTLASDREDSYRRARSEEDIDSVFNNFHRDMRTSLGHIEGLFKRQSTLDHLVDGGDFGSDDEESSSDFEAPRPNRKFKELAAPPVANLKDDSYVPGNDDLMYARSFMRQQGVAISDGSAILTLKDSAAKQRKAKTPIDYFDSAFEARVADLAVARITERERLRLERLALKENMRAEELNKRQRSMETRRRERGDQPGGDSATGLVAPLLSTSSEPSEASLTWSPAEIELEKIKDRVYDESHSKSVLRAQQLYHEGEKVMWTEKFILWAKTIGLFPDPSTDIPLDPEEADLVSSVRRLNVRDDL